MLRLPSAWSPDDKTLVVGGEDFTVRVIDTKTREVVKELKGHRAALCSVRVTNDRRTVLSGSLDGSVIVWHLMGDTVRLVRLRAIYTGPMVLDLSRDGRRVATGFSNDSLRVWDARTGAQLFLVLAPFQLLHVRFSSDCRMVLSRSISGTLWLSDARKGGILDFVSADKLNSFRHYDFNKEGDVVEEGGTHFTRVVWKPEARWKLGVWTLLSTGKWDEEMARELSHFF